jgi:GNAT superfamily N-acetyltransferase
MEGKVVGGSSIDIGNNIASLMGTSVLPSWRRRGIQTALIRHRLHFAAAKGVDLVTIHSHPGIPTERNATRLGFKLAYVKAIMVRPGEGLTPSP